MNEERRIKLLCEYTSSCPPSISNLCFDFRLTLTEYSIAAQDDGCSAVAEDSASKVGESEGVSSGAAASTTGGLD